MMSALLAPLNDIAREAGRGLRERAVAAIVTAVLALVAVGFLTMAGFVTLARAIGVPHAALVFALLFAIAAAAAFLVGRAAAARRAARAEAVVRGAIAELSKDASAVAGKSRALLPLAAFVTACILARRL
jgi:hypothetical protein